MSKIAASEPFACSAFVEDLPLAWIGDGYYYYLCLI